jgi:hypothetical protein
MVEEEIHAQGGDISNMVIMIVGEQDGFEFLLLLEGQAGGKPTGIYRQDIIN